MNCLKEGWFSEISEFWPGVCTSLKVEKILFETKSNYQDIMVLKTMNHGVALVLDGIIQCTEHDEFSYQEMISFLPLCSHPNPQKVLIVGGGDGGVAREVCKFPTVKQVDLVEIDDKVIEAAKKFLPEMGVGLSHSKLTVNVEDGFKFMERRKGEYDVIITDSSDPIGPAESLFQKGYYELMSNALKPGGIVCSQAGTFWENMEIVKNTFKICQQVFPSTAFGYACVPTYPTGQIGFALGSKDKGTNFKEPLRILSDEEIDEMKLKYYSSDMHKAAFVLPTYAKKALYS